LITHLPTAMKEVKLNTTGIKFTPSTFITYYEVKTNFSINNEDELLTLEEVKGILNSYKPVVKGNRTAWSIAVSTPLKEMKRFSR
jgi:hypothetical protein